MTDQSSRYRVQVSFENLDTGEWMEWDYPNVIEMYEENDYQYTDNGPHSIPELIGLGAQFKIYTRPDKHGNFLYVRRGTD